MLGERKKKLKVLDFRPSEGKNLRTANRSTYRQTIRKGVEFQIE